jgi:hypothetical protein
MTPAHTAVHHCLMAGLQLTSPLAKSEYACSTNLSRLLCTAQQMFFQVVVGIPLSARQQQTILKGSRQYWVLPACSHSVSQPSIGGWRCQRTRYY